MKKLVLCVNENKALTLAAIAIGVLVGIFGSATGWWSILAGTLTGAALLCGEAARRTHNNLWSWEHGKRWGWLVAMALALSVMLSGMASIGLNPMDSLGLAAALAAVLVTAATTFSFAKMAWEKYNPKDNKINLVIWSLFLGIIGLMATGCYALICWMMGVSISDLLHDSIVIYGGCISLGLIAIFASVLTAAMIAGLWDKLVRWAKK